MVTTAATAMAMLALVANNGASARPATTTTLSAPSSRPPLKVGDQWVSNDGNNSLLEFRPSKNGVTAAISSIDGSATDLSKPAGVAIDSTGRVWTTNTGTSTITAYAAQTTGNVAPAVEIAGSKTGLDNPLGLAVTHNGDVWVANNGASDLLEFAKGADGNVAPIRKIAGGLTGLTSVTGVAVSADGRQVWVSEDNSSGSAPAPSLARFAGTSTGNVKPAATISGPKTGLNQPYGIAVALPQYEPYRGRAGLPADRVTVDNTDGPDHLLTFSADAHGNATPLLNNVDGSSLDGPGLVSYDVSDQLWVPIYEHDFISGYDFVQNGSVYPIHQHGGTTSSHPDQPVGVATYGKAPTAARGLSGHGTKQKHVVLRWFSPSPKTVPLLGFVIRMRRKHHPWRIIRTIEYDRAYTVNKPKAGDMYDVEAFNNDGFGPPTKSVQPSL